MPIDDDWWQKVCLPAARRQAKQLVSRYRFLSLQHDDVLQDLLLAVWRAVRHRDTMDYALLRCILSRAMIDILRHKHKKCIRLPDDSELSTTSVIDMSTAIGLAIDVNTIMRDLPPYLRMLAEQLKTKTLAEIARASGISLTTLKRWKKKLRKHFHKIRLSESQ